MIRELQLSITAVAALCVAWGLLSLAAWALRRGLRALRRRIRTALASGTAHLEGTR